MRKITERPFTLSTGLLVYALLDLALFGAAALLAFNALSQEFPGEGKGLPMMLGGTLLGAALIVGIETIRASRGHRSARRTLTYLSVLCVVLLIWRRLLIFWVLGILAVAGAVLIWIPASSAYYQITEPRRQRIQGYARATRQAAGVWKKK